MVTIRKRKLLYFVIFSLTCILFLLHLLNSGGIYRGSNDSKLSDSSSNNNNNNDWSFKSLTERFDFSYLPNLSSNLKSSYNQLNLISDPGLEKKGYILEPGNVKFKFTNNVKKRGTPEQVINENMEKYRQLMNKEIGKPQDASLVPPPDDSHEYDKKRANATILALVRNEELIKIGQSIKKFQRLFNSKFNYPYTFINDQPFTERFKQRITKYTENAPVEFVVIKPEQWNKPSFIDEAKEAKEMQLMHDHNIAYAKKASYHNMCRFYLGQFYNLPELQKYKYYWRIEPQVKFFTDVQYDVLKYMEDTQKIYGFTVSLYDIEESVKTLWPETLKFLNQGDNYKYVNPNGSFQWLVENLQNPKKNKMAGGYSTCHFWSNFEIGDMDFFRSEAYSTWFKYLDSTGGFYYERWGDAPVHSIGVSLFADKSKIHWFRDLGYNHDPYFNCARTPWTSACTVARFSRYEHLNKENCVINWLEYDEIKDVY